MIRFALISPLRIDSSDWAKFSKFITATFKGADKPKTLDENWSYQVGSDYKYHPLEKAKAAAGDPFDAPLKDCLVSALSRVRKNTFAVREIDDDAVLVIFGTGECCVIELRQTAADSAHDVIPQKREQSGKLVAQAAGLLAGISKAAGTQFDLGETITHTVLLSRNSDSDFASVAKLVFAAEGLQFSVPEKVTQSFFLPGWSYSVCVSDEPVPLWDRVALMARAQCEWYDVRTAQDYCLDRLAEAEADQSVSELIALERRIVGYQTEFRLWRHRMQEYRANLKPELTDCATQVDVLWDTAGTKDYVHNTLGQTRDLIQTSYSRRILIQERRQSLMIFFLTSLGVLSIASIAATYWDWFKRAGLVSDASVASQLGQRVVTAGLIGLLVVLLFLVARFIRLRRKPE